MKQRKEKQIIILAFAFILIFAGSAFANEKRAICFGENLSEAEKSSLYKIFEIDDADKEIIATVTVSNDEEHKWLSEYVADDIIGTRALSSAYVVLTESGNGIDVRASNINFCTPQMYQNALQTAGVTDAQIVAAAPFEMSGTASLIGVLKAYEKLSGISISEECIDAAVNEFVLTGELIEDTENKYPAEELISYLKEEVVTKELDADEIKKLVNIEIEKRMIDIDDEKKDSLIKLLIKIQSIKTVSEEIEEKTSTQTYSTDADNNNGLKSEEAYGTNTKGILSVIRNKIKRFFEKIFAQ